MRDQKQVIWLLLGLIIIRVIIIRRAPQLKAYGRVGGPHNLSNSPLGRASEAQRVYVVFCCYKYGHIALTTTLL